MKLVMRMVIIVGFVVVASNGMAQDTPPNTDDTSPVEADLEQLRQLREALTEAVLAGDVEKQIEYADVDVVTVWQNNQVARGHDGLREFMSEISPGGENIFRGYTARPQSDDVIILPGGTTAIAYGTSVPHYKWLGLEFDLENRWTATLIKNDGQWKLATYHVSGNLVDNPLLAAAKNSAYLIAGITFLIGIGLGLFGSKILGRKRGSAAQ